MMALKVRTRVTLTARLWQGDPVEGFERVNDEREGMLLLIPTLDGLNVAHIGDWLMTTQNGVSFACPATMFEETYEVVDG